MTEGQQAMLEHLVFDAKRHIQKKEYHSAHTLLLMAAKAVPGFDQSKKMLEAAGQCLAKANGIEVEITI